MLGHVMLLKMLHCKGIHVKRVKDPTGEGTSRNSTRKVDFKKMNEYSTCRVCLKQGSIPIFGHVKSENISKGLYMFGGIKVRVEDPYPKFLCLPCNELLQGAILLRRTAKQSDGLLKLPVENSIEDDHLVDCVEDIQSGNEKNVNKQKTCIKDIQSECAVKKISVEHIKSENEENKVKESKIYVKDIQSEFAEKKVKPEKINIMDIKSECEETNVKNPKGHHCSRCKISFETFKEFYDHRRSEEHENMRLICPICNNSYTALYFKKHMAIHKDEAPYLCDICGKNFTMQSSFQQHRLIHTNKLPYKCPQCPYRGRGREALKMHMRSHTGEKPYQCTYCPSRFISNSNLCKHLRIHKKLYKFRCDTCDKAFYSKLEMEVHIRVDHMGIKDHVCGECGKAFGYRKQMMKHQLQVHKREKLRAGKMPIYLKLEIMNQEKQDTTVKS